MTSPLKKASLFLPCLADLFYPDFGRDAVLVLRRAGLSVDYPAGQTCCGQWAFNKGHHDAARAMAKHFLRVFGPVETVVSLSGSCVMTVKEHYLELFKDDPRWLKKAEALAPRVHEITDFLVNRIGAVDLGAEYSGRVTVHDSCHPLRGLGLKSEVRELLSRVKGLEIVEMEDPETCCGFGGAFMADNSELSRALVQEKIDQAVATGADTLVMTEPGCLLNVRSAAQDLGAPLRVVHLIEVLSGGDRHGRD